MRAFYRITLLAVGTAGRAFAGGFEIYEQGPQATGMAGAVAGKADDPSAIFYNPAGMAMTEGGGVQLGSTIAFTGFGHKTLDLTPTTTSTVEGTFVLPNLFASAHLGNMWSVGIGAFTQFGAGVKWSPTGKQDGATEPPKFPGRFVAANTQIQTFTFNPTFGVQPHKAVAIAVGLDVMMASVELSRSLLLGDAEGTARLGGGTQGVGWNFGVLFELVPQRVTAGIAYRSAIGLDFNDLRVHFDGPPELKDYLYDQPAKTSLKMPHNLTFGLATHPTDGLTITTDVHYTLWSALQTIPVTFLPGSKTPGFAAAMNWRDSLSARVGAEYLALVGPGVLALRAGFGYDLTPVPAETLSPSAPLADSWIVSGGLGYGWRRWALNVGYIAGLRGERASTNRDLPGLYSGALSALSAALTYEWGGARSCCARGCTGHRCCHK